MTLLVSETQRLPLRLAAWAAHRSLPLPPRCCDCYRCYCCHRCVHCRSQQLSGDVTGPRDPTAIRCVWPLGNRWRSVQWFPPLFLLRRVWTSKRHSMRCCMPALGLIPSRQVPGCRRALCFSQIAPPLLRFHRSDENSLYVSVVARYCHYHRL